MLSTPPSSHLPPPFPFAFWYHNEQRISLLPRETPETSFELEILGEKLRAVPNGAGGGNVRGRGGKGWWLGRLLPVMKGITITLSIHTLSQLLIAFNAIAAVSVNSTFLFLSPPETNGN